MKDFLLKFPSREAAMSFGKKYGFTKFDEETGEDVSCLASGTYAMIIIGEHQIVTGNLIQTEFGQTQEIIGDNNWWVFFRDLVNMEIPQEAEQYVIWSSASGLERPTGIEYPQHRFM